MNNEPIEGMVPTADGRYAVMVDTKNGHYGWVFFKHPTGMWVSSRKASTAELRAAEHHYNSLASFREMFGSLPSPEPLTVGLFPPIKPVPPPCRRVVNERVINQAELDAHSNVPGAHEFAGRPSPTPEEETRLNASLDKIFKRGPDAALDDVLADHKRLVRELDVLLNGEAGAAEQASLCDIVAQVRVERSKPNDTALRRAGLYLKGQDNGCNEVKTLRQLVAAAQYQGEREPSGIELAAKWVEGRATAYDHAHGNTDPGTGAREYPGNGDEYIGELMEIAEGIRALSATVGASMIEGES